MTDLELMRAVDEWPRWPVLPVKRYRNGLPQFGVLAEVAGAVQPIVYGHIPRGLAPGAEYDSLEALAADGWRVD